MRFIMWFLVVFNLAMGFWNLSTDRPGWALLSFASAAFMAIVIVVIAVTDD